MNSFEEALCTKFYPDRTGSVQNRGATFIYALGDLWLAGRRMTATSVTTQRSYAEMSDAEVYVGLLKDAENAGINMKNTRNPPPTNR
jgi:hypothetical protein